MNEDSSIIIVKRRKRTSHGHHGGAWKVAYADFVTAMMAFFLVMWILGVGSREQKAAIADYFKNPSPSVGASMRAAPGVVGQGGPSASMIKLGGAMDPPKGEGKSVGQRKIGGPDTSAQDAKLAAERDKARLEDLRRDLNAALDRSQALAPFKDQLLLDLTSEGLRIQIVDKQNRPMFSSGSAALEPYTVDILHELARFIDEVPNRISISGHTDSLPYNGTDGAGHYGNWELSADRANAARRALLDGGMPVEKVTRVVGLAEAVPLDKAHPDAPTNRRISIVVMTDEAAKAAMEPEMSLPPANPSPPTNVVAATQKTVEAHSVTMLKRPPVSASANNG